MFSPLRIKKYFNNRNSYTHRREKERPAGRGSLGPATPGKGFYTQGRGGGDAALRCNVTFSAKQNERPCMHDKP